MKLFEKFYSLLIFVVLALFFYLVRIDASDNIVLFSISLIVGSIFIASLPFLLNRCKKIQVRNFYIFAMCGTSLFTLYKGIYYLTIKFFIKDESINQMFSIYIPAVLQALAIAFIAFTIIYSIKDLFKKDYGFSKLDLQAFQMCLNLIAYISIVLLALEYSDFNAIPHFNLAFEIESITYHFNNHVFNTGMIIVSFSYIALTTLINLLTHYKYENR